MDCVRFDPVERAAILAEYDRQAGRPIRNYGAFGRPVFFFAVALAAVLAGFIWRKRHGLPPDLIVAMFAAVTMLGLAGGLAWVFGGTFACGEAYRLVEKAADWLTAGYADGSLEEKRAAAITVILHARYSGGPWTMRTYDPAIISDRLGYARSYVEAVEHLLSEERSISPVFRSYSQELSVED